MTYEDGHSHCFSCEKTRFPKDTPTAHTKRIPSGMTDLRDAQTIALKTRKISQGTCKKYGYVIQNGQQYSRYYNKDRQVVAQHVRGRDKTFRWEGDCQEVELYGQHLFPSKGKRVVVTEGEIDCLSVAEVLNCKWPVVSLPSGAQSAEKYIRQNLEWLEGFEEIVLAFDDDEPGRAAVSKVAPLFTPGKVKTFEYPEGCKDCNDMLIKGEEIQQSIWNASVYRPDGIVEASSLWDELKDYYDNGYDGVQYEMPWKYINNMANGCRKGELWLHTAGSGIGKSTIVSSLMYHFLQEHECTIGHVALEENCKQTTLRYMSLAAGKPLHLNTDGVSEDVYEEAFKDTAGSNRLFLYDHFGSMSTDNLLSKLRYLAVSCNCDFILLDHISIAVSGMDLGEDERRTIDKLMTDLRSLVEQTGVGIHVISHLRKAQGKSHEEGGRVTLDDLRGSASLKQLSDTIIGYERDQHDPENCNKTQARLLKCRLTGKTGTADILEYDEVTGRLQCVEPEVCQDMTPSGSTDF
jgi:twinkle protein